MARNQEFYGRFLSSVRRDPYQQLSLLTKNELTNEALAVVRELHKDKIITRYQMLLIIMALEGGEPNNNFAEHCEGYR